MYHAILQLQITCGGQLILKVSNRILGFVLSALIWTKKCNICECDSGNVCSVIPHLNYYLSCTIIISGKNVFAIWTEETLIYIMIWYYTN